MSKQRTNAIKSMTLDQSASIEINAPVHYINRTHHPIFHTIFLLHDASNKYNAPVLCTTYNNDKTT
jgi:hypothetical protein